MKALMDTFWGAFSLASLFLTTTVKLLSGLTPIYLMSLRAAASASSWMMDSSTLKSALWKLIRLIEHLSPLSWT